MPVNNNSEFPIRRLKKKDLSNEPSIINVHANCREITRFFGYRLQYNVNEKNDIELILVKSMVCLLVYNVFFFFLIFSLYSIIFTHIHFVLYKYTKFLKLKLGLYDKYRGITVCKLKKILDRHFDYNW